MTGLSLLSQSVLADSFSGSDPEKPKDHWAFHPVTFPSPPESSGEFRVENEIDLFVLDRLNGHQLTPSTPAEPGTLVRRIYFDLIGLPPTPEQAAQFESAATQDLQTAVENLVDRLLQSPHYGERWGRHWLDVARFSDGYGGFLDNSAMPHAWRYRDWVINALNDNMPYDTFLKMQIAGDLLTTSREDKIATGFFAIGPTYRSDGGDPDSVAQAKSETLDDRIDTMTRGMLGLTVSCARCHDHLFDPIPQVDYYSLAGVFNNTQARVLPISPQNEVDAFNNWQNRVKDLDNKINNTNKTIRKAKREPTEEESANLAAWSEEKQKLENNKPAPLLQAHSLADTGNKDMHVAKRGNLRKPGDLAPRQFLQILSSGKPAAFDQGSGRIQLADAIANRNNPVTARVFVNRVWRHHFGKAIVRTPSNFGDLGEIPTHPELLDWLATTFMESGWSIKSLHRKIMTSATYQMSSLHRESAFDVDGDNKFIWRMNPRRLEAEVWRDTLLSVTDELDLSLGGQPFEDIENNRRTIYFKVSRNGDRFASDDYLRLFDFPLMRATVAERPTSIVPQQFLFLMNSSFMTQRARAFAARLSDIANSNEQRILHAYSTLYGRSPQPDELKLGLTFLNASAQDSQNNNSEISKLEQYAQVLLSSNELMFVR